MRSFFHSGLIKELAKEFRITIFVRQPESLALTGLEGVAEILRLPETKENRFLAQWRQWAARVHIQWLEKKGKTKWRHYLAGPKNEPGWRGRLLPVLTNKNTAQLLTIMERRLAKYLGRVPRWAALYKDLSLDAVITSAISDRTLPALQTAMNQGIKTFLITNSWKDIHVKPHLPLLPTKIMVWNPDNAALFLQLNPWLRKESLEITGSLHLQPFLRPGNIMAESEFYRNVGLTPGRPYICYTAAAPRAVRGEEDIVAFLLQAIRDGRLPQTSQVLLRLNPMEDGSRFQHLLPLYHDELVIQKPHWEWRPELDWCCALPDDVRLWVSTVFYARVNVSIPSTVTLEFAALKKPVFNVCFDLRPQTPEESNRRFWEADFYTEIRKMAIARPCYHAAELLANLQRVLKGESTPTDQPTVPAWLTWHAVPKVATIIKETLNA